MKINLFYYSNLIDKKLVIKNVFHYTRYRHFSFKREKFVTKKNKIIPNTNFIQYFKESFLNARV